MSTVRLALTVYKQIGLIFENPDGTLSISDYQNMIGSETDWAAKNRKIRSNAANKELQAGHDTGHTTGHNVSTDGGENVPTEKEMLDWTFANDNGHCPQMHHAHRYVEQWQTMHTENIGLLFWGGVGTGKSFLAGCIANALMAQEVPVRMTNFAHILNELNNNFSGRNEVVDRLCCYPLLIIDDFGMERGTEYALEQIYNIIDSRYRSRKPLIVTTNLTLDDIRHPQDTAHARIYDRLLEMCVPVSCIGVSFRKETTQEKLERLKELIG